MRPPAFMFAALLIAAVACGPDEPAGRAPEIDGMDAEQQGGVTPEQMDADERRLQEDARADALAALSEPTPAPDFTLPTLSGEPFSMADHEGEVVLVNFWATWCAPCRQEMPDLIALHEELADEGLTVVGVSVDAGGFDDVRPFAEEMGISYPLVHDVGEVSERFGGVYALPTTFIVGRDGLIRHAIPGMMTEELLRPLLEKLLAEPAAG